VAPWFGRIGWWGTGGGVVALDEFDVYKAANQTVNNSTTIQDDDDLVMALGANEVWGFQMLFYVDSTSAADFKCAFSIPAGASGFYRGAAQNGATEAGWLLDDLTTEQPVGHNTADDSVYHIVGVVINGANAGNLQFRWAQSTMTAVNTIVRAGSWLSGRRLA
jgi:hypothetical protein